MKYELTMKLIIDGKGRFDNQDAYTLDSFKNYFDRQSIEDINKSLTNENAKIEFVYSEWKE